MRTSIQTALMAILLLPDLSLAKEEDKVTVTIYACEPTPGAAAASDIFYPGLSSGSESDAALPTGGSSPKNFSMSTNKTSDDTDELISITTNAVAPESTRVLSVIPFFTLDPHVTISTTLPEPTTQSQEPSFSFSVVTSSSEYPTTTKASSTEVPASPTTSSSPGSSTEIPFLRGVNLGGWLVLEKWMTGDVFTGAFSDAADQWTFDSISGAEAALQSHWSTYFTEADIQTIAATGINALRIPIGYWAYDNSDTPYIKGADAFLEKAIGWARNAGMKVWIDCHGSPGSQNGFDNSGHASTVEWQQTKNLQQSISVLKTIATKYGTSKYADVVVGLQMINEPISWGNNIFSVTESWAQEAYTAVKAATENENLVIVMHDAFMGPLSWTSTARSLISGTSKTFGIDTHLYQVFVDSDNTLTQDQHITKACGWADNLASSNAVVPTYVGEWSPATNICVNPDGSTTAGTSCSISGCQCQSANFDDWNENMITEVRKFVEAQLDVFESSTSGYFMWSAKGPGGWGFLNGISNGAIPNPVTSRKFSGQCGNASKRRQTRGSLGAVAEAF